MQSPVVFGVRRESAFSGTPLAPLAPKCLDVGLVGNESTSVEHENCVSPKHVGFPLLTWWPLPESLFFLLARVLLSLVFRAALST